MLLLRCLPSFQLQQGTFDWALFQTLEQQVAWHDHLVRQSHQVDVALLPSDSQCMLDLLVEIRERLQAGGLEVWPTTLSWMGEIEELSALSKWLLQPDVGRLPTVWAKLAARPTAHQVDPREYVGWSVALDEELVCYAEQAHAASCSLLNIRATQLGTLAEQPGKKYPLLEATAAGPRCFRFSLLQRFNQLLHKYLPLVHTGNSHEPHTLGGRVCRLRGAIFMEVKHATLELALSAASTDADAMSVSLNRFRASRTGVSASARAHNSLFCQLHEQLRLVKPRTLCR